MTTAYWPSAADGWWQELAAAGVRVVDDPRNIQPPCAYAEIQGSEPVGGCATEYRLDVWLIAPGPAHADALRWLWGHAPTGRWPCELTEYADHPAIRITVTLEV